MDAFPANSAVYTGMVNATNIVDLGLTWRPSSSPNTILSLNANNLLDHRHMFFPGTPALGRVVLFKIQHTFGVK
jgi:outer membrane receptor protein involved in Fe transport